MATGVENDIDSGDEVISTNELVIINSLLFLSLV